MKINIKKINKEVVKPIPIEYVPPEKIKGYELFPEIYSNIFLVARKKSGKTCSIFKILKTCAGKRTKMYFFASSVNKDDNWKHIIKYFKKKGNDVESHLSFKERLPQIFSELKAEADESDESDEDKLEKPKKVLEGFDEETKKKERKEKKISPEIIFVFDDQGNEMRSQIIYELLKMNRHMKCKCIISCQYVHNLTPEALKQCDYFLVFGGNSIDKLEKIVKDADLPIDFDLFLKLYENATKEKYNFLYIDTRDIKFRKNFNKEFKL